MNIGERGARATVGIPGTGLSYSERVGGRSGSRGIILIALVVLVLLVWFFLR